jgi:hypothetical protein
MSSGWIKAPEHLVIDTVPLLLLLVGAFDPDYLPKFKRLSTYGYSEKDYYILRKFILSTKMVFVTPGVLSEISNFLENDKHFSEILHRNLEFLVKLKETYVNKINILTSNEVFEIAFTDTSLVLAAKSNNGCILTRDFKLWGICKKIGVASFHLDHVLAEGNLVSNQ